MPQLPQQKITGVLGSVAVRQREMENYHWESERELWLGAGKNNGT